MIQSSGVKVQFDWHLHNVETWIHARDPSGEPAMEVAKKSAESKQRYGKDETRVLVAGQVWEEGIAKLTVVPATWGCSQVIRANAPSDDWLPSLGVCAVVVDETQQYVLLAERKVNDGGYGLWHTAAHEGVEVEDIVTAPPDCENVKSMALRAVEEECGITKNSIRSFMVTGVEPLGWAGWQILTAVFTTLTKQEMLEAVRFAPDAWEGDHRVVSAFELERMVTTRQNRWTLTGLKAHQLTSPLIIS